MTSKLLTSALLLLCFISKAGASPLLTPISSTGELYYQGTITNILSGIGNFVTLSQPSSISIANDAAFLVDAGNDSILRFHISSNRLLSAHTISTAIHSTPASILANHEQGYFLADPFNPQVILFNNDGTIAQTFTSDANLISPGPVQIDNTGTKLYVADTMYNHIVVFNRQGWPLFAIGSRGEGAGELLSISDIALLPIDKLYVLDELSKRVQLFTTDGAFLQQYRLTDMVQPRAMAIDRHDRIFVSDSFNDTIKIYHRGQLLDSYGGHGNSDSLFNTITDLEIVNDKLYVVDSGNAKIKVFAISPPGI